MKKILLFFTLIFLYQNGNAQCTTKHDDYDKYDLTFTQKERIGDHKSCGYCTKLFFEIDVSKIIKDSIASYFISFTPEYSQSDNIKNSFKLLTNNGKVIEIGNNEIQTLNYKSGEPFSQGSSTTIWYFTFVNTIGMDQLKEISNMNIKGIKVGGIDYTINQKKWKKFWENNRCVFD